MATIEEAELSAVCLNGDSRQREPGGDVTTPFMSARVTRAIDERAGCVANWRRMGRLLGTPQFLAICVSKTTVSNRTSSTFAVVTALTEGEMPR